MNANEILDMIGDAKGRYIWDAQQVRSGAIDVRRKRLSLKRVWLVAACIVLALLLVGCAVVYALRMQDMKVGEYSYYIPTEYDDAGNVIPAPSREPLTRLSQQGGANMEALAEWTAFTNTYDPDLSKAQAADRAAREGSPDSPWNLPDNYHLTYDCYNQEMVDKLDAIVKKYGLKLLSEYIPLNWYESSVLLDSLGIGGLFYDETGVEYWDGDFHLEGSFDLTMYLTLDMGDWTWERGSVDYHYSLKEYFDPQTGYMQESHDYRQWDYTRKDGKNVLLVLNQGTARIYADLPDAFISIYLDPIIWIDGEETAMTAEALEQLAELFDLSIHPQSTDMATVERYRAEANARYEEQRAAEKAKQEAQYVAGYQEFVNYRLETLISPETASYVLWDVNGDGVEELVISGWDMLSMKDGHSYQYFDLQKSGVMYPRFRPCAGNVFEIWCEDWGVWQHYFYAAGPESAEFITGIIYDSTEDIWYRSLSGGTYTENREPITEEEVRAVMDSYTPIEFDWLPLKKFGQPVMSIHYTDPYARYIADRMDRYDNASEYTYTLMDLNGDGIDELITRDANVSHGDTTYLLLNVHTIRDGELWDMGGGSFTYVCEGGVLEWSGDYQNAAHSRDDHEYYRCTTEGLVHIESVFRDDYWGHKPAGQEGKAITEENALSIIGAYKRLELDMKPCSQYPMR